MLHIYIFVSVFIIIIINCV